MRSAVGIFLVLLGGGILPAGEQKRLAIPGAGEISEIEKTIKSVFAADYAKKDAADQVEFAKKLLKEAEDTTDSPAGKYVLLREAQFLAARGGDFELATRVSKEMADCFKVDAGKIRWELLNAFAVGPSSPGNSGPALNFFLASAVDAVKSDDYESASKILKLAAKSAKDAKNLALATALTERGKIVDAMEVESKRIKPDIDAWKTNGAGTEQLGRFLCFFKGDWAKGLPMLAKSTDPAIHLAALKDLENPTVAAAQLVVADGWWKIAAAQPNPMQPGIKNRARHWYQLAVGELVGFSKVRAVANIAEAESLAFERIQSPGKVVVPAKVVEKVVPKAAPKDKSHAYVFRFESGPNAKTGTQRIFEPVGKGKWEMRTEQINLEDNSVIRTLEQNPIPYVEVAGQRNEVLLRALVGTGVYKITSDGMFTYRDQTADWYRYPGSGEWVAR